MLKKISSPEITEKIIVNLKKILSFISRSQFEQKYK